MSLLVNDATARLARITNTLGLGGVNHAAKQVIREMTRNRLEVEWGTLRLGGPADSWTILHQIRSGTFEPFERDVFARSLRPGMTVLDIGANIGFYSLLASRRVAPTGSVVAFEPDPRTRKALLVNLRLNGATNVRVSNAAVSSRSGSVPFYLSATATHSGLHASMNDRRPRIATARTLAIDELGIASVDVVKLDIEGAEPAALRGMQRTLAASVSVRVFLEFSPAALSAAGHDPSAFARHLCNDFRDVLVIDETARQLVPFDPGSKLDRRINLLCSGRSKMPAPGRPKESA